jgi:hypothetical protein
VTGPLLALALAAVPLAQEEWEAPASWEEEEYDDDDRKRLFLSAWAGEAVDAGGAGRSYTVAGGEVAWAFRSLDLGVAGYAYGGLRDDEEWTPVGLLRLTQRFPMRSGIEGAFTLGLGAARPGSGWDGWFQVALGVRVPLGPLFVGGEIAFERGDLVRFAGGLGLAL